MGALVGVVCTAMVLGACGDDHVNAAGEYTLSITNRENGCGFSNWTEGDTATGIALSVTQSDGDVTGSVGGSTRVFLDLWLGSHTYTGSVDGNDVSMTLYGTVSNQEGNCTYTVNSTVEAELDGDVLVGDIRYTAATNGNPDCASLQGCVSRQSFNGTRPPR
jgi:hypothetical protein